MNGALVYLPGTHKIARYENAGIGEQLADLFEVYPEWLDIEPVAAAVPAGLGASSTTASRRTARGPT